MGEGELARSPSAGADVKLVDLHFNPTAPSTASTIPTLTRSPSSFFSLSGNADKRKSLLSIDGALDALKGPREVWKGVKTNLGPGGGPGGDVARKRGEPHDPKPPS